MKTYENFRGKSGGFITFSGELKDAKEDTDLEAEN